MKPTAWVGCLLLGALSVGHAQVHLDLSTFFDTDAVLEPDGVGLGEALDDEGRRIDAGTLPADYADGSTVLTPDGRARFRFAPFREVSLDAVAIDGQVILVPPGQYDSLDLALLAAPGAFLDPFTSLEFRYADASREEARFGPVPGWFDNPAVFDHTLFRYTDDSQVQTIIDFPTDFGADEALYLWEERGNGNSGGTRFIDGTGFALYWLDGLADHTEATLGITVGNNFVVSLATDYWDPEVSTTEGYTVVANSMELHDGFEHRALGNLKQYDFDLSPYLSAGTGDLFILLTDATPANGWGPFLQRISVFTGAANTFEETLQPALDPGKATVHAAFLTNGNVDERAHLYDNSGSGPSNRGHRFADAQGSITYRFDLPDDLTDAGITMDLANNFVVSLAGPTDLVHFHSMTAGTAEEAEYLVDEGGSIPGGDFRFADGTAYMTFQFDLPAEVDDAYAQIWVGNQFVIEAASGTDGVFVVERDWVAETGQETRDNSNLAEYTISLTSYLEDNPEKIVQLRFADGVPADGWGPYLKRIVITNREQGGEPAFQEVLNSEQIFGEDIRDEYNKGYYTADLSPLLADNPGNEVFVKFSDGSTGDGWGPGVFWLAVHSGEIELISDRLVFDDLKTTAADPDNYGSALLHRRYGLDPSKTLSSVVLPGQPAAFDAWAYLLAATLNSVEVPPVLQITSAPDNKVRLSWPASHAGYRLQSASHLTPPIAWVDLAEAPEEADGVLSVELPLVEATAFYRLRQ